MHCQPWTGFKVVGQPILEEESRTKSLYQGSRSHGIPIFDFLRCASANPDKFSHFKHSVRLASSGLFEISFVTDKDERRKLNAMENSTFEMRVIECLALMSFLCVCVNVYVYVSLY